MISTERSRRIESGSISTGCSTSPSRRPGGGSHWLTPTLFHVFDGAALTRISDPPNATDVPYIGRMLLLPTGQVLFAVQTNAVYAYIYFSCPDAAWRPQITSAPSVVHTFLSYTLSGRLFNGMSQAVGYDDDATAATNYPLVRIRHLATGNVRYCRTFDHSTMGVATGAATVSTNFQVPGGIQPGPSELCVVANGISSPCVPIDVRSLRISDAQDWAIWALLIGSLADGDLWVLGPNGPIPVDPWGPKFAKPAREARANVLDGLKTLQKLGSAVTTERKKVAAKITPAPDEGSVEAEEMEEAAKERLRLFAKNNR